MALPNVNFGVVVMDPNNPNNSGASSGGFFANAFTVVPSDTVNFGHQTSAIWVGTGGNVVAVIGGTVVTFLSVPSGSLLPVQATKVNATNTTATNMVGLY